LATDLLREEATLREDLRKRLTGLTTTVESDSNVDADGKGVRMEDTVPRTYCEERICYIIARQRHVRCRLWYEVTPFMHGLFKYFLVGIQQLE